MKRTVRYTLQKKREREKKTLIRRNNSSSQKYAVVQPGPLSTGSMTGPGRVIPLIEECAALKLLSAGDQLTY